MTLSEFDIRHKELKLPHLDSEIFFFFKLQFFKTRKNNKIKKKIELFFKDMLNFKKKSISLDFFNLKKKSGYFLSIFWIFFYFVFKVIKAITKSY